MAGFGLSPAGSTPFGFGTPDQSTPPPTVRPGGALYIDPVTKDYVVGPDGEYLRMPRLRQKVLLAISTIANSSTVLPAGVALPSKIDQSYERRVQSQIRQVLAFLVTSGEMRIDSIVVDKERPGRTAITVSYTDLLTGEADTASTP